MHGPSILLWVHKLLTLSPHHARWNVVDAKSTTKLNPWHLVVRGVSGSIVGPPRAGVTTQLMCNEESLLHLRAMFEPKLGLNRMKPVIGIERLSYLGEEWRMSDREVIVGGRS
jgi:hypothetical protein